MAKSIMNNFPDISEHVRRKNGIKKKMKERRSFSAVRITFAVVLVVILACIAFAMKMFYENLVNADQNPEVGFSLLIIGIGGSIALWKFVRT